MIHKCVGTVTVQNSNNQNKHIYLERERSPPLETVSLSPPASYFPPNICALFVKNKNKNKDRTLNIKIENV